MKFQIAAGIVLVAVLIFGTMTYKARIDDANRRDCVGAGGTWVQSGAGDLDNSSNSRCLMPNP